MTIRYPLTPYYARKWRIFAFLSVLVFSFAPFLSAAIIGTNQPALFLTDERIATLPQEQRPAWKKYLERSYIQNKINRAFWEKEIQEYGIKKPTSPPESRSMKRILLDRPPAWYRRAEARRIADIIVSFQMPAGGWGKNLDVTKHRRHPGELFGPEDRWVDSCSWFCTCTFDNDATIMQLRYLAKFITAVDPGPTTPYLASFFRGINYIFSAQYPNGGWPQEWPFTDKHGAHHSAITYNDGVMFNILEFLRDVSEARGEFSFVPVQTRTAAATSLKRGIECVLKTQIVVDGRRTVWCSQHDMLTLQPTSGRKYEMISQVSSESADIMMFLMKLRDSGTEVISAVHAAAAWFEKTAIHDVILRKNRLISSPGKGSVWARFYEIGTDRPIFGNSDGSIHDSIEEISEKLRNGYDWYRQTPINALKYYISWSKAHPR